ncbi:MAG: hypothetical protein U5K69_06330 [Balneolaceae bacterium]|nr:hypothetical protein [Balneolaceae bacterium]
MTNHSQNWIVLKFGGTSVSSLSNWKNIASILQQRLAEGFKVCLVHSALSGVSNKLEKVIALEESETVVEEIKKQHRMLAQDLGLNADELLEEEFQELEQLARGISLLQEAGYQVQARIMALGELMSTKLGVAYLQRQGIEAVWKDARTILQSVPVENASEKSLIMSAVCDTDKDEELQQKLAAESDLIITQGYIASNSDGNTVVLGRGGSDVSAAYFSAKLSAERLEIWTDVPGMFSSNPHEIPSARLLNQLSLC